MPDAETATANDALPHAPVLDARERRDARRARSPAAPVIHEVIREQGESELRRPSSALAWSGLAAGLSMGFSMITEGLLHARLPAGAPWTPLVASIGYSVGFVLVVLGRQQLFTENTLTAVLPLLAARDMTTLARTARLWTIVLVTNLAGATILAYAVARTAVFEEWIKVSFAELGRAALDPAPTTLLVRGVFAGWLIAMMVWLLPAARASRLPIIVLLTWLVGVGQLSHVIAGSVEVLFLVARGDVSWFRYFGDYLAPTLAGNTLGGVALVAALNHAQVVAGEATAG